MKNKLANLSALLLLSPLGLLAQENKHLSLEEIIHMAANQSVEAKTADTKVLGRQLEVESAKSKQLPDAKLSGQYMAMTTPNVDLKLALGGGGSAPDIAANQLWLGQASVSMPIYTGGKIKGGIAIAKDALQAEQWNAVASKEQLASRAIALYLNLYKAQQTNLLITENIKQSEQRVSDFKAMLENGLIARNDLLKAELQLSNYQVSLQEAQKNIKVLNYQLANLLKIAEDTQLDQINLAEVTGIDLGLKASYDTAKTERSDLKSLASQRKVAEDQLKVTRSSTLPTIAATAGYNAFGLQKVVTVTNAAMVGIGVSYDIGSLYKNKREVNVVKNRIKEIDENLELLNDRVKVQVQQANENYMLAQKQDVVYHQAVDQAVENYRITKDKYDNGIADTDDLLTADVQQLQSKINLAISKANTIEKYYDLLLANGSLKIK
ncbi:MAG: transporter [Sphingobacterium sp.]|jgi:outer membrane protein TolC|uniref:TolC family protein n=1 Tax=unclassified Sphingobacterium TaxID=2609468 RepID=UPI000985CD12|nr:TolC family protein [Sphingobacterium sp. CZ-UAM]MDF2516261.1 transporter [Sphingobacterium sp.]OOG20010.1 transporter [Sphingobacterium sp. CZ-UAM]